MGVGGDDMALCASNSGIVRDKIRRSIDDRWTGHSESAIMRMKLTRITPVLAAGAAAVAIAVAPTAAAQPTATQLTGPSTAVASQVVPAGFHGGGGGFHGGGFGDRGFHGDHGGWGWHRWGWNPWGWGRHW
jgi:hypothetical protein